MDVCIFFFEWTLTLSHFCRFDMPNSYFAIVLHPRFILTVPLSSSLPPASQATETMLLRRHHITHDPGPWPRTSLAFNLWTFTGMRSQAECFNGCVSRCLTCRLRVQPIVSTLRPSPIFRIDPSHPPHCMWERDATTQTPCYRLLRRDARLNPALSSPMDVRRVSLFFGWNLTMSHSCRFDMPNP